MYDLLIFSKVSNSNSLTYVSVCDQIAMYPPSLFMKFLNALSVSLDFNKYSKQFYFVFITLKLICGQQRHVNVLLNCNAIYPILSRGFAILPMTNDCSTNFFSV